MYEKGEQFLARIININPVTAPANYMSPHFKSNDEESSVSVQENINPPAKSVELQFCVFNKGSVTYLNRTLYQVKNVMSRVQRRVNSPTEQCQIAKWILDLEKFE